MKKNKYILIIITVLLSLSSCNEFIEHEAYGPPSTSDFWKTDDDLRAAVDGLRVWQAREDVDGRGITWLENCSDNLVTGRSQAQGDAIKNFQMQPTNGRDVKNTWKWMYTTIGIANDILRQVDDVPNATPKGIDYAKSNALFYRALSYLWIAPYYGDNGPNGGIPIVSEETPIEELDQPRPASVLDNYNMIIEDFRKAAELLPYFSEQNEAQWGRPHKAAAWGFAARAALYASQYDSKYYDVVLEMTDKIMKMTGADKRSLYNDYTTLFREANNFSSEYIFSIFGTASDGPKFHGMSFQKDGYGLYNTWGYFQPTIDLYEAYEEGDTRRDATIILPGQHISFMSQDIHFGVNPSGVSSTSGITFRKWMHPFRSVDGFGTEFNSDGNNQSTRMGLVLLRYADVLLMRAEALIWKQGEGNSEAKKLLNQIRERAGLPANSQATKRDLMNERRCELAFEFQSGRHLDIVRWGLAKELYAKPLFGLRRKSRVKELGLADNKIAQILGSNVTQDTYLSDINANLLPADAKQKFDEIYEPNIEKNDGYTDRPGHIIEGWVRDTVWPSRNFNPNIHHVFPIPQSAINSSNVLKQNQGY